MVVRGLNSVTSTWWQCGDPDSYHDLNMFDLETEKCTKCKMDLEEYWYGYESEINDTQEAIGGYAYRVRRAASCSRPATAVYVEEGEDSRSPKRPERAYILMGMGE